MPKLTKSNLIKSISTETGYPESEVLKILDAQTNVITKTLKSGDAVTFDGLGVLKPVHRKARTGRNPKTGEPLQIAASNSANLKISKTLKLALN